MGLNNLQQLTAKQELSAWKRWNRFHRPADRDMLILSCAPLAIAYASKWNNSGEANDRVGHALLALCQAFSRYDYTRGIRFSTFLTKHLSLSFLRYSLSGIHRPPGSWRKYRAVADQCEAASHEQRRNITSDDPTYRGWEMHRDESVPIDQIADLKADSDSANQYANLKKNLDWRTRIIIRCYFWEGLTLGATGLAFGITRERVRQIMLSGYRKMRAAEGSIGNNS